MAGIHFEEQEIEVTENEDLWGPFAFKFPILSSQTANDGVLPYGDTLSSVSVKAYLGKVRSTSDLSDYTDISDDLIDPSFTPVVDGDDTVKLKLQHPGSSYRGEKATLVFTVTLASNGVRDFFFQYVKIA